MTIGEHLDHPDPYVTLKTAEGYERAADTYADTGITILVPPALAEALGLPRRPEHPEVLADLLGPNHPAVATKASPDAA